MLKFALKFLIVISVMIYVSCTAYAVCEHNFECDENKSNLIYNEDMTHSYLCLNGCGSCGTVKGGINSAEECTFSLFSVKRSTCTEEGIRIYMCTVCGRNKEEKIQKTEHSYIRTRKLPTCTQNGYDLYRCSVCGENYRVNFVLPVAHISDGGIMEALPDYNNKGILKVSCRVCETVIERKNLPELIDTSEGASVPGTVSNFKVKSYTASSVKLTWEKCEYALYYNVYYSTDKKKWKSVSSEKTSVTVKRLKPARKYYFKISAAGDGVTGAESRIITVCTEPEKAVLREVASAGKSAVMVKWKKQSNVSGYEISYSLHKFSKRKSIKKYNVSEGAKKTVKKLKRGKKYYFRIRAYKKFGSKKVFGAYSETKTVKIR